MVVEKIKNFVKDFKEMTFWVKMSIYLAVYVLSHFSITVMYHLGLYNYSISNNVPFISSYEITISSVYPSIIYLNFDYLASCLFIFILTTIISKNYPATNATKKAN